MLYIAGFGESHSLCLQEREDLNQMFKICVSNPRSMYANHQKANSFESLCMGKVNWEWALGPGS